MPSHSACMLLLLHACAAACAIACAAACATACAAAYAGESPFNEVCSPLIRWLAVAGGLPICKLLVQ